MTIAKAAAFSACLVGAAAIGFLASPHVRTARTDVEPAITQPAVAVAPAPEADAHAPVAEATPRPTPKRVTVKKTAPARPVTGTVIGFSPDLYKRVQPLLNRGADMAIASDGFRSAEQFATVAHASRNTEIPFMVLKDRVVGQGMTLASAIQQSKSDIDGASEAKRARSEAKADLTFEQEVAAK